MTSDCDVLVQCLVVKGILGEQHKMFIFNPEKMNEIEVSNRAGDTDLEFNMNSHIRKFWRIFLIQTESNGAVTAKQLDFDPLGTSGEEKANDVPPINFTAPRKGSVKDCWVLGGKDSDEKWRKVMTISMSTAGNFIASDCIIPLNDPDLEQGEKFDLERRALKIEAQEVHLSHPCVASNIGNNVIMV